MLLFSLYFSSLNPKYLKLTKMDITRFAMKLFIYQNKVNSALVESVGTEEIASTYEGLKTIEYKEKRT